MNAPSHFQAFLTAMWVLVVELIFVMGVVVVATF